MKHALKSPIAFAAIAAAVLAASSRPALALDHLIMNEIVANEVGSPFSGEWIEIYNPTSSAIDLSNYKIGDEETKGDTSLTEGMFQFPTGSSIAPGQLQIVSSFASRFIELYGFNPTYEVGSSVTADNWVDNAAVPNMSVYKPWDPDGAKLNMANNSDQALLLDGSDNVVDSASWDQSTFYMNPSLPAAGDGQSWERVSVDLDTNTAADWRLTPAAPTGATWMSKSTPGSLATVFGSTWTSDGDGAWIVTANWQNEVVPAGSGSVAVLGGAITDARTVSLLEDQTIGTLRFDSANAYTIDGTSQLIMNAGTGTALVQVVQGSHTISAPVTLAGQTVFYVASSAAFNITSNISSDTRIIAKSGGGTLTVNRIRAAELRVGGGTLAIRNGRSDDATSIVKTLSITAGASLDLGDNALVVDYSSATSPLIAITTAVADGRITSNKLQADARYGIATADTATATQFTTFGGATLDATAVLARVALKGDANIDGQVNFSDLVVLAQNYNITAGAVWTGGDTNYDGAVNFSDLVALAQNYNASESAAAFVGSSSFQADWALAQSLVPEPMMGLGLLALALPRRRSRR